jgi:hypothetical protein
MASMVNDLLVELGYPRSQFYRETAEDTDISVAHLLRDARRANVLGSYFIRTAGGDPGAARERPVVHIAEANTPNEARQIHRQLWNQGTTPFLLVTLPGQVRIYTGFAYSHDDENVGQIEKPFDVGSLGLRKIAKQLEFLHADSIDSGEIWRTQGRHLTQDTRVDRSLLRTLRSLSQELVRRHHFDREVAHALIGRFVYLYYLRDRGILSDQWLSEAQIDANAVFSATAEMKVFRRLTDKVDERFNGRIFPIDWSSLSAPQADAVRTVAQVFAGEEPISRQMALFRPFDFSFIPIELLSAIYEQFLHDERGGAEEGAFYTSEPVADYLIAEVESVKKLNREMKVLDPCCGSGIFLVLTYRRLIEQELRRRKVRRLLPTELRDILKSSIFGVERNSEACLVTEFSLILTLLSYIDPPELHRHTRFRFPTLHNEQVFECDFFDDQSRIWKAGQQFDWIVGNVPWVELDQRNQVEQPAIAWIKRARESGTTPVARYRINEAFTWRVRERLADGGVAGLITQATSLTNDQSAEYRRAFFQQNDVHRITNFSNLAYVLFESAEEPAASVIYSVDKTATAPQDIVHFGPLIVHQPTSAPDRSGRRRVPWVLTVYESEIQTVPVAEAVRGEATTWKRALWGNPRDRRALDRLRRIFPITLEDLSTERGWHFNLGLQLRTGLGSQSDPNQDVTEIKLDQGASETEAKRFALWFSSLKVIEPRQLRKAPRKLTVVPQWLVQNRWGTYIRKRGGPEGLNIISAPHLFFWNDFAAFSEEDFIFRHPKLGLSAPSADVDWLRAVSVIWTASITPYCLFLELSAGWGISRSTIDLGDVRRMPMPNLTDALVAELADLHRSLAAEEGNLTDRSDWQCRLDERVTSILKIPKQVMMLAREFNEFRLPLVKGKAPSEITSFPDEQQLETYARRLASELDGFLERKNRRHCVTVLSAPVGIVATIELVNKGEISKPTVKKVSGDEAKDIVNILGAAAREFSQWVYVRRSVRIFAGDIIYLCKPNRRLEWTQTQALLDAADIIAEVTEARGRHV